MQSAAGPGEPGGMESTLPSVDRDTEAGLQDVEYNIVNLPESKHNAPVQAHHATASSLRHRLLSASWNDGIFQRSFTAEVSFYAHKTVPIDSNR
jgi:hypothetical protein